ncbi:MAG: hypothetical protein ACO1OT_05930 [Heyndrickxia sp.]
MRKKQTSSKTNAIYTENPFRKVCTFFTRQILTILVYHNHINLSFMTLSTLESNNYNRSTGFCVFEIPVPEDEMVEFEIQNEMVQVDGNFTLFRVGNIDFTVENLQNAFMVLLLQGKDCFKP